MTRILIVNADDFGRSTGINRGVVCSHEQGIVTSASLMVRYPAAVGAAAYARNHREFSVGLHVDLGEWVHQDGEWTCVYELDRTSEQIERQLNRFRDLLGEDPTHIDSHQHIHRTEPVNAALVDVARRLGVPLRSFDRRVKYRGDFYGQTGTGEPILDGISVRRLIRILHTLANGVTELGCHPGEATDLVSSYAAERAIEVKTLCDLRVRKVLSESDIQLRSFRDAFADS
jgi:predicted glycoside hydrolase/deacetylase ChbG (UPF0249 family)